jgi:hypothetical protein
VGGADNLGNHTATKAIEMGGWWINNAQVVELTKYSWNPALDFRLTSGVDYDSRIQLNTADELRIYARSGKSFLQIGNAGSLPTVFTTSSGGIRTQDLWVNASFRTKNLCIGGTSNLDAICIDSWGDIAAAVSTFSSDARLKKDVSTLENMSDKVDALRGISYRWNNLGKQVVGPLLKNNSRDRYGFVAQEVQKIFPDLVEEDEAGYLRVDYVGLIAPAITAIQEQKTIIDTQQSEIDELRAEIEAIKAKI